jgi:hypothetical protein
MTYNILVMNQQIEIKRKIFEVIETLGERSKKVIRKNKEFFLKDFGDDVQGYERYLDSAHKLSVSGILSPKVYCHDKKSHIVVAEYIPGLTALDDLLKDDLPEEYFAQIFAFNWYMKNAKILLNFDPKNYKFYEKRLYYIPQLFEKYDEKKTFEKAGIWYWFYCREFTKYLETNGIAIDQKRADIEQAAINKKIALTVVKHYR